jgi:ribonucleoside-diphosphate reductase alpha chain
VRNVHDTIGSNLIEVNNEFESLALENGFYSEELVQKLIGRTSIQDIEEIPEQIRRLFVTAFDVAPEWHIKTQAAFQKYTDNGVSKTVNLPAWATPQDVEKSYMMAYDLNCKGITIYRDSSKSVQILQTVSSQQAPQQTLKAMKEKHEAPQEVQTMTMASLRENAAGYSLVTAKAHPCPECSTAMLALEGCYACPKCNYSKCG